MSASAGYEPLSRLPPHMLSLMQPAKTAVEAEMPRFVPMSSCMLITNSLIQEYLLASLLLGTHPNSRNGVAADVIVS